MDYILPIAMFAVGVVLVVKGGDIFVDAASWIARAAGIPPFIIGATIVSLATTMPEMIVSCMAAAAGKADMAIGNAVGSVTANTGLILGIALVFMAVTIRRKAYMGQCLMLVASAAILLVGSMKGTLAGWASVGLIVIFLLFMVTNVRNARTETKGTPRDPVNKKDGWKNVAFFLLGTVGIVLGSRLLVDGGSELAKMLGVPERIIAVTLVAIGTSLPELVTTLTAIRKRESHLSVGNIIGANIIDLTLILPACSLVSGSALPVSVGSLTLDMPACLGITVLAVAPLLFREKGSKIQGFALLSAYVLYLIVTL